MHINYSEIASVSNLNVLLLKQDLFSYLARKNHFHLQKYNTAEKVLVLWEIGSLGDVDILAMASVKIIF